MSKFEPLTMMGVIKNDTSLKGTAKNFLWAAITCTNERRRVKESLQGVAHYAGMSDRTVRRLFDDEKSGIHKYFQSTHHVYSVNLDWNEEADILTAFGYAASTRPSLNRARKEAAAVAESGQSVNESGHPVTESGHFVRPSVPSSVPSSVNNDPAEPVEETEYDPFSPLLDRYKTTLEEVTPLLTTEDSGRESAVVEELTETVEDMNISLATLEVEETNESEDSSLLDTAKKKYAAVPFQGRTAAAYSIEARACMKGWDKTGADADMAAAAEYLVLTNEFMPENIDGGSRFGWACVEINKWRSETGALTW